jgi:hypothetical protein
VFRKFVLRKKIKSTTKGVRERKGERERRQRRGTGGKEGGREEMDHPGCALDSLAPQAAKGEGVRKVKATPGHTKIA